MLVYSYVFVLADPTQIDSDEEHYNPNRPVTFPPSQRYIFFRYISSFFIVVTHAGIAAGVGRALSRVCLFVCLLACVFVHALTGKRLELSTPNLVQVYSIAVAQHAFTQR